MTTWDQESLDYAKTFGYSFPEGFASELSSILENADLDWYNNSKEGVHEFFNSYESCICAYLEGYYNELDKSHKL
jgi:hypothetical protein